jgi:ketosteroid isomerase-like protein
MSKEDVELVKTGYRAFVRGDIAGVLEILDPDVETSDPFGFSTSDAYHGHEGFVETVRDGLDAFERYDIKAKEFIDAGNDVIVSVRISGVGRESGADVDMRLFHVWTVREGKGCSGALSPLGVKPSKPPVCRKTFALLPSYLVRFRFARWLLH